MEYIKFLFDAPESNFGVCEICLENNFLYEINTCKHEFCQNCIKQALKIHVIIFLKKYLFLIDLFKPIPNQMS